MMTRRITLTLAAATLTLVLIGILVFAATGRDQTAADATAEKFHQALGPPGVPSRPPS